MGGFAVLRLGRLYRAAAADLALARRRFPRDPVRQRLERLVASAALAVYSLQARRRGVRTFFAREYWMLVAERRVFLGIAATLLLLPAIPAVIWATSDPAAVLGLIPGEFEGAIDPPSDAGAGAGTRTAFSAELFTHNISVTFLAFALGITAGIGTGLVLALNGLILGSILGLAIEAGNGKAFFEFVVPHGPLELSCIVVTAAAGISLGWALVSPGAVPRQTALASEARHAVAIVLGTMPWLVAAGVSEAFVRSSGLSSAVLIAVGVSLFLAFWGAVVTLGARPATTPAPEPSP